MLSSHVTKNVYGQKTKPFAFIFNLSLETNDSQDQLKLAKVTPILRQVK